MAEIPMRLVGWTYNTETNRIRGTYVDEPPADHPDPAHFEPTQTIVVELQPQVVEVGYGS